MPRKLYFGQPWNEPGYPTPWISFEDNPQFLLTSAKTKFCQACLSSLKKGLLSYQPGQSIDIGPGAYCWKAVVSIEGMSSPEEVKNLLQTHQDDFLPGETRIHGKVGGGETPGQQQIMMQCDTPLEADIYKDSMKDWLRKYHSHPLNSYSIEQGCKHPFLELFGPVPHRTPRMVPASPEAITTVLNVYLLNYSI